MMLIYGHVNNYSRKRGMFIPYFGYKIGPYQAEGYLLNFPKLPYPEQYYNAIFLKLWAYNANDSVKYIQWHYDLYPDKKDFLLFLQRELRYRIETLDRIKNYKRQSISRICLEWVTKELNAVYDVQKIGVYNQFIKNELTVMLKNELQNNPMPQPGNVDIDSAFIEKITRSITDRLQKNLDAIVETTGDKMEHMAARYEAGEIELANHDHREKLITLFLCLKNLQSRARKRGMGASLFTRMGLIDIAKILRLHIVPFKSYKADTVEKNVGNVNTELKTDSSAYVELDKALQKFFFNQ